MNSNENPLCVSLWSEKFQQNSISVQTFFRLKNTLKKKSKVYKTCVECFYQCTKWYVWCTDICELLCTCVCIHN